REKSTLRSYWVTSHQDLSSLLAQKRLPWPIEPLLQNNRKNNKLPLKTFISAIKEQLLLVKHIHGSFQADRCKTFNQLHGSQQFVPDKGKLLRQPLAQYKFYLPPLGEIIADAKPEPWIGSTAQYLLYMTEPVVAGMG